MENPMNKWMIWGVKTPIFGSTPIYVIGTCPPLLVLGITLGPLNSDLSETDWRLEVLTNLGKPLNKALSLKQTTKQGTIKL